MHVLQENTEVIVKSYIPQAKFLPSYLSYEFQKQKFPSPFNMPSPELYLHDWISKIFFSS